MMYPIFNEREVMVYMIQPNNSGLLLLKKQRAEKNKRLEGLTLSKYFQSMEEIRNGLPPNPEIKKYLLWR